MSTQDGLSFAEWLRDELDRHHMRQQDLADLIGADQSTVSAWVNGLSTPQPKNCRAIARAFGVDEYEVLRRAGRRGMPPRQPPDFHSQPNGIRFRTEDDDMAGVREMIAELRRDVREINQRIDPVEEALQKALRALERMLDDDKGM